MNKIPTRDRIPFLTSNLSRYPTLAELRASAFFAECHDEIEALLGTAEIFACSTASPRLSSFIRVTQWNVEKGRRAAGILDVLQRDPVLQWADAILLNEADRGMNRSGNRHVAAVLADGLGMHMAFAPAHLELTKGTEDELLIEGENQESMQGNAILSRHPIAEALVVSLPVCFEPFEFSEKRYGRRVCLWARLKMRSRSVWIGSVHLEVRNTPRCRALQMRHVLSRLPGGPEEAYLLGGDLNTNGFSRGTQWRTLTSMARLVRHSPSEMRKSLVHPERGCEPLFRFVREARFAWEGFNSEGHTATAPIGGLEEAHMVPAAVLKAVRRRMERYRGHLQLKLDWLLARGIRPLGSGDVTDAETGVVSVAPGRVNTTTMGPERLSDHLPIYADISI